MGIKVEELKAELQKSRALLEAAMQHLEVTFAEFLKLAETGRAKVELIYKSGLIVKLNVDSNKSYEAGDVPEVD